MSDDKTLQDRIEVLEASLQLDSRLTALEKMLRDRTVVGKSPWWRDAKTITILGTLIAVTLPLLKLLDESLRNSREYHRQIIEQQEKIRQAYLDRVLRPGTSEVEQQRLFGLLAKLSSDPELQTWAQEELKKTSETIEALKKQKDEAERHVAEAEARLTSMHQEIRNERIQHSTAEANTAMVTKQLSEARRALSAINERLGSTNTPQHCSVLFNADPPGSTVAIFGPRPVSFGPVIVHPEYSFPTDLEYGTYVVDFMHSGYKDRSITVDINEATCGHEVYESLEKSAK